jgi:carbonic anhydrase/acetyltransferase-like protein (isoleucine patch superfamily)
MIYALGDLMPHYSGDSHWVAESATIIGNVEIGLEVSIWWNAVIRADNEPVIIGDCTNIQDGSVLHTDPGFPMDIGKNVTIGHMCMLHGCIIGEVSLIGIGSVILNGAKIGKNCIIGANTLITEGKNIPDNSLVMGSPGKIQRELSPEEILNIEKNANGYVARSRLYRNQLKRIK